MTLSTVKRADLPAKRTTVPVGGEAPGKAAHDDVQLLWEPREPDREVDVEVAARGEPELPDPRRSRRRHEVRLASGAAGGEPHVESPSLLVDERPGLFGRDDSHAATLATRASARSASRPSRGFDRRVSETV
jgi:hypothetical protein